MKINIALKILVVIAMFILVINASLGIEEEEQELRSELLKLSDVKEEMTKAGLGVTRFDYRRFPAIQQ